MNRWRTTAILSVAIAALAGQSMVACGTPSSATTVKEMVAGDPHSPEATVISSAVWQGTITAAFWEAKGILAKDYDVKVESDWASDANALRSQFVSGGLDVIPAAGGTVFDLVQSGIDVRIVAGSHFQRDDVVTLEAAPSSGINSLKDLKGKKVATVGLTGAYVDRVRAAALDAGINPASIKFVQVPYGEMAAALDGGVVDAAVVQGLAQSQARAMGSRTIYDIGGGERSSRLENVWVVRGDWYEKNPNTVAAFQCAIKEGGEAASDRGVVESFLRDELHWSDQVIAASPSVTFATNAVDPASLNGDLQDRIRLGDLPKDTKFDWAQIIVPAPDAC